MSQYIHVITGLLSLGFAVAANAQQQPVSSSKKDSVNVLNEVIVKENRIQLPFSQQNRNVWIIDQEMIKRLPVRSVSELLSFVTGVDVRQRGPGGLQADISIDGGTFDQALVLINGVKVADSQTGHNMMNLPITLDDIDHVEVLRGSASRVYGLHALTGAINLVTRKAQKTGVSAHLFAGSSFKRDEVSGDSYTSYGAQARASLVHKGSQHSLSVAQEAGNGYRYNTAFNNQKVFYQSHIPVAKSDQLEIMAGYIHNNFGANGFYSAPGDKESEETVKTLLAAVGYTTKVTENWTITPRLSYRHNVDDYLYIKQKPDKFHNHHQTNVFGAEVNNTILTTIGTFGLGIESRMERINSTNLGKRNRSNTGIYGEYKFEPLERLLVNVGAYANYNSDYGWQAFPGIDAGYNFYGNWRLFANLGSGQRLPTYTDLYYQGPTNIGNDMLEPEQSTYAEGGLKYNQERLTFNVSYFYRSITNFIDWIKASEAAPWKPENFSQLNTKGFTFHADYQLKKEGDFISSMRLGAGYTHLNPRFKTTQASAVFSRYALESLRNQLSGTLYAEVAHLWDLTLTARYNERINYKNYTVFDARVAFKQAHYNIYVSGVNLLNVEYIETGAVPMPGSWFTLGIKAGI